MAISAHGQKVDSFIASDGETLYFTKVGKGQRVIMLSGGPGQAAESMKNEADSLSSEYECILFDQRGTGLSSNVKLDSTTINLERATEDIDDLRKYLKEDQVILCGASWGGSLAQAYAAKFPENTKKIVLISTMGPDLSFLKPAYDNMNMRSYPNERDSLTYWMKQPESENAKLRMNVFALIPYFYDHKSNFNILLHILDSYPANEMMSNLMWKDLETSLNLKGTLINYKGECIIIRPRQDIIPAEVVYLIKDLLPQSKIYYIEKCGHLVSWEQPEEFFKILRDVF